MEQEFNLEIYPEIHCDECGDIVHNHINCPICLNQYASSNIYHKIDYDDKIISCEECGSEFERIDGNRKVKLIKNGRDAKI